jgi:hypothetical protein
VKATLRAQYGGWQLHRSRTAMGYQSPAAGQLEKGSEKPTLQREQGKGLLKETPAGDFRKNRIFVIESSQVFWGTGTALSARGRDFLDAVVAYVSKLPDRLVISEFSPGGQRTGGSALDQEPSSGIRPSSSDAGLLRATAVLSYLNRQGIAPDRCSIATQGMSPEGRVETQRRLEIALLGRNVYQ